MHQTKKKLFQRNTSNLERRVVESVGICGNKLYSTHCNILVIFCSKISVTICGISNLSSYTFERELSDV